MMSFADDYIKLRGDHSAKQSREERWRDNRGSKRAKNTRGKSDVTPTSWAYASEGELEREQSGDFAGRGPLERYDGPSAQDIGAYSFPVYADAPETPEQPARRLVRSLADDGEKRGAGVIIRATGTEFVLFHANGLG